jgi:hypothetical protein
LARILGIERPRFLSPPDRPWLKKLAVFVPESHLEEVRNALAQAGAGIIGDYTHCSFQVAGTGTFSGGEHSTPKVGSKGRLEQVPEVRLEMIHPAWKTEAVVRAMIAAHPYEEVAYDIYPLENEDVNFGYGAIGDLTRPLACADLLRLVKEKLGVPALEFVPGATDLVTTLAVCGGSAGDMAEAAWKQGAQAYVTGEMKYHALLEFDRRMAVILVGHYTSEIVILPVWIQRLQAKLKDGTVQVVQTKQITNPVQYIT